MIQIKLADSSHVQGIINVCRDGYTDVSKGILSDELIQKNCEKYYNKDRITNETSGVSKSWGGYFVAIENNQVVGAGGGGLIDDDKARLYVLYLNPSERNRGIGSKLLEAITIQQKNLGAKEQYITVQKDNMKGIPFYKARGFTFVEEISSKNIDQEPNAIVYEFKRNI